MKQRAGALLAVIRTGASSDPDVEALWARIESEFYENQRPIVEGVEEAGALPRGLDVMRAAPVAGDALTAGLAQDRAPGGST